ncbi:hypothetical protein PROFUN_11166 [Planoprotostelium fungivorum]|uniref:C3H1-type domain-containing protein n=1 Tax=Planoprotostelium fungivorum TaxID=1890364 RepID=A0A2P6NAN2_9EUKA|nr:hypothetical protein PROFUN_11166 [Planoprotostelium fungivorum]
MNATNNIWRNVESPSAWPEARQLQCLKNAQIETSKSATLVKPSPIWVTPISETSAPLETNVFKKSCSKIFGRKAKTSPIKPPREQQQPSRTPSPRGSPLGDLSPREEDRGVIVEEELSRQNLYKTELCRSFQETGSCRYGHKCQFAHGAHELRPVLRHPKYKTEICKSFTATGSCTYGNRCRFIHQFDSKMEGSSPEWSTSWMKGPDGNGLYSEDLDDGDDLLAGISRLSVFQQLAN